MINYIKRLLGIRRHFLIVYQYISINGDLCTSSLISSDFHFPYEFGITDWIKGKGNVKTVVILNIIELSKQDAKDWHKKK